MNAEQASKKVMRKPTVLMLSGRPPSLGERATAPSGSAGVLALACMHKEDGRNTGSPAR